MELDVEPPEKPCTPDSTSQTSAAGKWGLREPKTAPAPASAPGQPQGISEVIESHEICDFSDKQGASLKFSNLVQLLFRNNFTSICTAKPLFRN